MELRRLIACVSIVMFTAVSANAQKNFFRDAERYFRSGMVERAIDSYKKAYNKALPTEATGAKMKKLGTKGYIKYRLGDCYYRFREIEQAQQYYETAIKLQYDKIQPDVFLKLAQVHKEQSNYDEARDFFQKYFDATGDAKGKEGVESCKMSLELMKEKTRYKVAEENVLNTDDYDFSPLFISRKYDEIFFTSDRKGSTGEEHNDRTGGQNKDVWYTKRDPKGHWSQPQILNASINTEHDEGAACTDRRGKRIFFTRCIHDKKKSLGCDIYTAEKKGKDWGEAELITLKPEGVDSVGVGHPALAPDDKYMLFASDMPGGMGGVDIWMTVYDKREKTWGAPVNLGAPVNTKGNDMFPYIRSNGDLYISSDGHAGLGGLDIFKCPKTGEQTWGKPENMGVPINGNADDYGIIFEGEKERGLFTSSRKGKSRDDIYSFNLPPKIFKLTCYVMDKDTKEPITNAEIKVVGSDGNLYDGTTDDQGVVEFDRKQDGKRYILEETNYNVEVGKQGEYLNGKQSFTTVGLQKSENFVYEFLLQSTEVVIRLPLVRYDFDRWELQVNDSVNSKDSLNFLYDIMVENPTIVVQLRSHTDCRGNDKYNEELAQKRAESCVNYLVDEKGIAKTRLVPLGRGEYEPLPGLKCGEIDELPTENEREAAHQLNRRTDCKILSWDFVPDDDGGDDGN